MTNCDIILESFQSTLKDFLHEKDDNKSDSKKGDEKYNPYQKHFLAMMKKWGIKSIHDLKTDEDKKKFFDDVNKSWKSKKEKKEEK